MLEALSKLECMDYNPNLYKATVNSGVTMKNNKLTKIVATISDRNCSPEFISELYENGLNVVRLNTAHQQPEDALKVITNVRKISSRVGILIDTKGPEVRTSKTEGDITLKAGDKIQVRSDNFDVLSTKDAIQVSYPNFVADVPDEGSILIDDGELELKVIKKHNDFLECKVMNDGVFSSTKSVNVPDCHLQLPSLTAKDKKFVKFSAENDIDFIAHSFVRNKEDILCVRRILDKYESPCQIIAKIENREGVDNIDEILEYADGIMVARGDLGIEIPAEEVPVIQKLLIQKAIEVQKPVITATQMLHTMIKNPRPTRAEVSDIANAIFDGTDAVMLSGETAYGAYPVEALKIMAKIAKEVEGKITYEKELEVFETENKVRSFLAHSAFIATHELPIKAIVVHSLSGHSARVVAGHRGRVPIYAKCYDKQVMRQLSLTYGVYAYSTKMVKSVDLLIKNVLGEIMKDERLDEDDLIVMIGANPCKTNGYTDFLEILKVGDYLKR